MGKGSRSRRKKKRAAKKGAFKGTKIRPKTTFADIYSTLTLDNGLPENINFVVK